jgi:hypothetical protein
MGIGLFAAEYMARAAQDFGIRGSALTLGRQDVWIDEKQFAQLAVKLNLAIHTNERLSFHDKTTASRVKQIQDGGAALRSRDPRFISDELLFAGLGFRTLDSADASSFEGATVIHDFNQPGLADAAKRQFDFVFDGGTTEHVFHLPNMMRNIFDALTVGGYVLHAAPSNNHVDHGFYQFSPTLFYDWYGANGWSIRRADFFRYAVSLEVPWEFTTYTPGSLGGIAFGGLDSALYGIMFCAQKRSESTWDRIPQQNYYVKKWPGGRPDRKSDKAPAPAVSLFSRISRTLRSGARGLRPGPGRAGQPGSDNR